MFTATGAAGAGLTPTVRPPKSVPKSTSTGTGVPFTTPGVASLPPSTGMFRTRVPRVIEYPSVSTTGASSGSSGSVPDSARGASAMAKTSAKVSRVTCRAWAYSASLVSVNWPGFHSSSVSTPLARIWRSCSAQSSGSPP